MSIPLAEVLRGISTYGVSLSKLAADLIIVSGGSLPADIEDRSLRLQSFYRSILGDPQDPLIEDLLYLYKSGCILSKIMAQAENMVNYRADDVASAYTLADDELRGLLIKRDKELLVGTINDINEMLEELENL